MPQRICPRLAFSADRRHAADVPDADHVCTAQRPAQWLERSRQLELCLTDAHIDCPRFIEYQARLASHRHDDPAVPSFPFVSTRLAIHPDPAWRGLASRAAPPAGRRIAAGVAGGVVLVAAGAALAGAAIPGPTPAPEASSTPTPGPTATETPRPTRTANPVATETPAGTPSEAPTASPTPEPSATLAPVPTALPQQTYVVQEGDTLSSIAQRYGVSVQALQTANGISDPDALLVGQVLVIP